MKKITCLERCLILKDNIQNKIGVEGLLDGVLLSLPLETLEMLLLHVCDYYNIPFSFENGL